jgi:hypothetical protein
MISDSISSRAFLPREEWKIEQKQKEISRSQFQEREMVSTQHQQTAQIADPTRPVLRRRGLGCFRAALYLGREREGAFTERVPTLCSSPHSLLGRTLG